MLAVAIGWQLYALTGRALDLGLVGLVQFLTQIVLTLVVGEAADRYERRGEPAHHEYSPRTAQLNARTIPTIAIPTNRASAILGTTRSAG